ncbi:MAG: protein disulfide oxidoreductase [Gammaproteobacteria bacterium]|nr:MAG: protein disulfide oxidoreductase [Gammaproteobacteria bacterium]
MASSRKRIWRWSRDILIALLIFGAWQWWTSKDLVTGPTPPLVGFDLEGQPLSLADLKGRPVLVHFWATWCPVCRLENGSIDAIARDHAVLAVATTSGSAEEVRAYMAQEGLHFPVLLDEEGGLARQWQVSGVPATFVVNRAGDIAWAGQGFSTEIGLRLWLWWAE